MRKDPRIEARAARAEADVLGLVLAGLAGLDAVEDKLARTAEAGTGGMDAEVLEYSHGCAYECTGAGPGGVGNCLRAVLDEVVEIGDIAGSPDDGVEVEGDVAADMGYDECIRWASAGRERVCGGRARG